MVGKYSRYIGNMGNMRDKNLTIGYNKKNIYKLRH